MIAAEHSMGVQRTARYYTLGNLSGETSHLWIVCHGYAQLAGDFIKQFEVVVDAQTAIVAPEALSRFYPKAGEPRVGATWMTKEDRENEINDYVNYLNQLYSQIIAGLPNLKQINILGFSQGCPTVCRWVASNKSAFNNLWLCAGDIPADLDLQGFKAALQNRQLHLMVGTEDRFVTPEKIETVKDELAKLQPNYQLHMFTGGHVVDVSLLKG